MGLSDEMQRLADHIHEAYEGRVEAVAAIRAEAVEDLAELHTAHQEMAAEAARDRAGYVDSLRASVASTRASIASEMKELKSEMGEAHRVWVEFGGRMRQARAGVAVTPPARAPEHEAAVRKGRRRRKGWARG